MKRWENGDYTNNFQDVEETNLRLSRANMTGEAIKNFTKAEISQALGVDAILSVNVTYQKSDNLLTRSRSRSSQEAQLGFLALAVLSGAYKSVPIRMTLFESESNDVTWAHNVDLYSLSKNTSKKAAKEIVKSSSKRFPYLNSSEPSDSKT